MHSAFARDPWWKCDHCCHDPLSSVAVCVHHCGCKRINCSPNTQTLNKTTLRVTQSTSNSADASRLNGYFSMIGHSQKSAALVFMISNTLTLHIIITAGKNKHKAHLLLYTQPVYAVFTKRKRNSVFNTKHHLQAHRDPVFFSVIQQNLNGVLMNTW